MSKTITTEGKTSNEAIEKALKELNATKEDVTIKIIEEKKKSFFSILDPHVVKVEVTLKNEYTPRIKQPIEIDESKMDEAQKELDNFLKTFLKSISDNISYKIYREETFIKVDLLGNDASKLIGYRGEALNALQLILSTIAQNFAKTRVQVILNIGEYRSKREKTLEELAKKIENTVTKTGKKIVLEPMPSYERKVIHTCLQDSKTVDTYSIGKDSNRRVVVTKK